MTTTTVIRNIQASSETVFDSIAHIQNFSKIVPDIVNVEFLTEQTKGVGTRFKETRMMGKREASTELEVTEYEPHSRVRMVSDAGGTIWDSVFTVTPNGENSVDLKLVMEARAYKFLSKLVTPLIKGMVQKAIEKDMDAVKAHCEK